MKTFNNFSDLAQAKILTGTPVRILEPTLVDGVVESTGEGLALLSGNVFVTRLDDQEIITGRKMSLLDDSFPTSISTNINKYKKNDSGNWVADALGRTSNVFYNGQIWWANEEVPYTPNGYSVLSWSIGTIDPDVLDVTVSGGLVVQFTRYRGTGGISFSEVVSTGSTTPRLLSERFADVVNVKDFGAVGDGVTDDTAAIQAAMNYAPKWSMLDCGVSSISTVATAPSWSSGNVSNFEDFEWPDNAYIRYQGQTREQVHYINNISEPYSTFTDGIPVNEFGISSPYHTGLVIDTKTPASFKGVKQTAHIIADNIGSNTTKFGSFTYRLDGALQYIQSSDPDNNRLIWRTNKGGDISAYVWALDRESGYQSFNRRTQGEYPVDVAGEISISTGVNNLGDSAGITKPRVILKRDSDGNGMQLSYHPTNSYGIIETFHSSVEGDAIVNVANSSFHYKGDGTYGNSNESAIRVSKNGTTSRSINASGTINASGSDYAEYMRKSDTCNHINPGDICGINSDGLLTDIYSEAISFVVKSTNPSFVGGDEWREDRSHVDRIAFCGQVPINTEAEVGDYIVPTSHDDGRIGCTAIKEPDYIQYRESIGKVIKIINGLPTIIVKIA